MPTARHVLVMGLVGWSYLAGFLSFLPGVQGWGEDGHVLVANVAWELLADPTQQALLELIGDQAPCTCQSRRDGEDCPTPLGCVADWADQVRHQEAYRWSAPLHYLDVQDPCPIPNMPAGKARKTGGCHVDYSRDCPHDQCIMGALVNYTRQLTLAKSSSSSSWSLYQEALDPPRDIQQEDRLRRESLYFLTHFVGDIHQPLHCARAADRGGNSIAIRWHPQAPPQASGSSSFAPQRHLRQGRVAARYPSPHEQDDPEYYYYYVHNLHAVWDDGLIWEHMDQQYHGSRDLWQAALVALVIDTYQHRPSTWKAWVACVDTTSPTCPVQWAEESLQLALHQAYVTVNGSEIESGADLGYDYYASRWPVVQEQLAVAGVRLALVLTQALTHATTLDEELHARIRR